MKFEDFLHGLGMLNIRIPGKPLFSGMTFFRKMKGFLQEIFFQKWLLFGSTTSTIGHCFLHAMDESLPLHIRQDLKQLGLTYHDVLIISYLFHADKASVQEISRQTAISFSTCEYLCNNLHRMGLLTLKME